MNTDFLWVEKYRPKTIEETILPIDLKKTFQQFVDQKNIPNLILAGTAGVGKTTVARAMLEQLECDYIVINGSMNGNIDTLRNEILNFASSVSLTGGRKYVILDEADYLNANSTQPALRNFMEEFSRNCGFILTCNFKNRVIEPLHSRCSVIDFKITKKDMPKLAMQFLKRVENILQTENVEFDRAVLAEIIQKYFPDWRRVLNELQRYSATGSIDSGILANLQETSIRELVSFLKDKNFTEVRKWAKNNIDSDVNVLYNQFYDVAADIVKKNCIPQLVLLIAQYQYQNAFAANTEINFVAFLTEAMLSLEFV
ncbi:HolB ATPase involved in DNA replication [uncultured Caudovirales phage]|uniref:Sliding-clamp-loader large subunit n=1 Tax=uncultured Caudovirales phage TaxID=2100421 RepID=A0A6J5NYY5_9CAUD|nr:HolB ATPase involved in DNA replication [uncultured Caudovirales phage]